MKESFSWKLSTLGEEDGGGYLCECVELPGIMGDGKTEAAALADAKKALEGALGAFPEWRRRLETPYSGKLSMRLPISTHRNLAERARREKVSINTMATTLIAHGLGSRGE